MPVTMVVLVGTRCQVAIIGFNHILFYLFRIPAGHAFNPIICSFLYQSLSSQTLRYKSRSLTDEIFLYIYSLPAE